MDLQFDKPCVEPGCDRPSVLALDDRWLCKDHALQRMSWLLVLHAESEDQHKREGESVDRLLAILFWIAALEFLTLVILGLVVRAHECS